MSSHKTYDLFGAQGGQLGTDLLTHSSDLDFLLRSATTSELRQVPDTQEVFLSSDSDVSIVFEILEKVEPNDPEEAAKFHFDSLAHDNDAAPESCIIDKITTPTSTTPINPLVLSVLYGTQLVPKFNSSRPDKVNIFLAVYRFEQKNIDVTMVFNVPVEAEKEGSAIAFGSEAYQAWVAAFAKAVGSFNVIDYGLFV